MKDFSEEYHKVLMDLQRAVTSLHETTADVQTFLFCLAWDLRFCFLNTFRIKKNVCVEQ